MPPVLADADERTRAALPTVLAPLGEVERLDRLTGGLFATTYRATLTDGTRVVAKTAPTQTDRLLTYELDLLRSEAEVYRRVADRPDLLMPRLLLTDFSRTALPSDVVVASHLDGTPLLSLDRADRAPGEVGARVDPQLGALMARLHTVTGDRFGYVNAESGLVGRTWPEAFARMIGALLDDAAQWGTEVPAAGVRGALTRHERALAEVTRPALVHTDLWPGNLFVDASTLELTGVIDPERAAWADPLLEFAGADQMGLGPVPEALCAGYVAAGGDLPLGTPAGDARLLLYRVYMSLVLLVEMKPRGNTGPDAEPYRAACEENLRVLLDALA